MTNPDWEIELFIRVTGRGRIGADGMVRNSPSLKFKFPESNLF
jgi:hypothetical protein